MIHFTPRYAVTILSFSGDTVTEELVPTLAEANRLAGETRAMGGDVSIRSI